MDITGKDDAVIMEQKKTERINRILTHPSYIEYVSQNAEKEQDRVFCHHDMGHFLDVARLAEILNLTEAYGQDAELIYAAALLHDIGRHIQYETGEKSCTGQCTDGTGYFKRLRVYAGRSRADRIGDRYPQTGRGTRQKRFKRIVIQG